MSALERIANALERMVEQNDRWFVFNEDLAVKRLEADALYLEYWKRSDERASAEERRKEGDELIKSLNTSMDRAKMTAQAREWLKLVDDDGDPKP